MQYSIINNKKIFAFNSEDQLLSKLDEFKGILLALGAEKILNDDKDLEDIINKSLTYCDGYGAVYALKRKGVHSVKIPGAYLWISIIKKYYLHKSIYLLGSNDEVINKTKSKLEYTYPNINILGFNNGYFKDNKFIIDKLISLKPDIVFVALGSPKQEFFMDEALKSYNALYMGLGGSFDLYVGNSKKVPLWWNRIIKWEGLYRTLSDLTNIKRIKRQKILFKYLFALITNKI
mgnify:CR=1 FL=1